MRSKFIVNADGKFPTDEEVRSAIRRFGWEPREASLLNSEKEKVDKYAEISSKLFEEMPEVAQPEKADVIYSGFLSADQTSFVVTRSSDGEITYRLLQPELPKLIQATEKIIKAIEGQRVSSRDENIIDKTILVYEKGHDYVILRGRVVENKLLETARSNLKDAVVVAICSFTLIVLSIVLATGVLGGVAPSWIQGVIRLSVPICALFIASLAGLIITYREITNTRVVSWNLKRLDL
jgi:hypothetical protein